MKSSPLSTLTELAALFALSAVRLLTPSVQAREEARDNATFDHRGIYSVRPDLRKCISPLCGGYWVSLVNRKKTPCLDGTKAEACYVASIDWSALGLSDNRLAKFQRALVAGEALVRGKIRARDWGNFGMLGELVVTEGFIGVSGVKPLGDGLAPKPLKGRFVSLQSNGIACITYPCFNIDESILNTKRKIAISDVDVTRVDATDREIAKAKRAIATRGLIAFGLNRKIPHAGPAGIGVHFVAKEFYFPIKSSKR